MSDKSALKPLAAALGTVLTVSLANIAVSNAEENPFSMKPLSSGYMMLAEGKCGEGKCGEGKCGAGKADAGKAAEGRCGMGRMDADGDGNVTREEFMQGHEVMFDKIDQNGDGVQDLIKNEPDYSISEYWDDSACEFDEDWDDLFDHCRGMGDNMCYNTL